jgi:copper chaperone CopZ
VAHVTLTSAAPDTTEFELVVGGMTCAACAARVQAKLNKIDGVTASVNLATERAHVTAPPRLSATELVKVVEAAGYSAELAAPAGEGVPFTADLAANSATVLRLRRRLILALVFFVPLTDLSIVLSIFPLGQVHRLAVAPGRAGRPGRHLGGLAVPPGRAAASQAPVLLDGHAGVDGHPRGLRLVGLRDVLP